MADVSISSLPPGTPLGTDVIPYSNGTNTSKVQVQSLPVSWNSITNKPTIPAAQIQSDWNQANSASLDFIKNKPTVGIGGMQLFTSSGTFTVPTGVTKIKVICVGGGGSGAGGVSSGTAGSSSSITGIDIIGGGGGGGGGTFNGAGGVGGTSSGSLKVIGVNGQPGVAGGNSSGARAGGQGFFVYGLQQCGSGSASTIAGGGGGAGGSAMGIATVTSGSLLTVNVGAGGGNAGAGLVLIEW